MPMPGYIVFVKAAVKFRFPGKNSNYVELPFSTKYMLGERDSLIIPACVGGDNNARCNTG